MTWSEGWRDCVTLRETETRKMGIYGLQELMQRHMKTSNFRSFGDAQ